MSVARASGCLPPAADSAGLTVDATVSISTALLPTAGSRRFVELSTPLVWDGSQHLLLEFSMENTVTDISDRSCIGFKFAADRASTAGLVSNNRARTAFAYIYDDECWATQSYPWSGLSAEGRSCTYSGRSMTANGYTGVVMDVALRTGRVVTTSTASTSSSASSASTLPTTTTAPRGGGTSTAPGNSPPGGGGTSTAPGNSPGKNTDGDDDDDDAATGKNIAIEFAVLFAVCTVCLIVCVVMQRLALRDAREQLRKYEAVGNSSIGGGASAVVAVVRNKVYSDVTVSRVDDNAGLIENGGDGTGSSSA